MFKKLIKSAVLAFSILAFSFNAQAAEFKENVNYKILQATKDKENNVREFYSYWCGHCFSLQPVYTKLAEDLEKDNLAKFEYAPVSAIGGPVAIEAQKGFFVAKNKGYEKEYNQILFKAMHVDGYIPRDAKDIVNLLASLGIPHNQIQADMNSFVTIGNLAKIENLMKAYNITSVPELVVNGKYLIIQESIKSEEELLELIKYTLTLN